MALRDAGFYAQQGVNITPSDTVVQQYRGLYVALTGTLTTTDRNGNTINWGSPPTGSYIWCETQLIKATGTSATVVGLN